MSLPPTHSTGRATRTAVLASVLAQPPAFGAKVLLWVLPSPAVTTDR
ncbi:hypothetical protein [Streptomyces olivaceus]|nr:hypothetical protein [Streptomyces olivaceus]MBZ6139348.1 hypothetical protein [Streptomyces olivaceus]MBZ6167239.1 hypothetical protein [Streptomyces olivaceus]